MKLARLALAVSVLTLSTALSLGTPAPARAAGTSSIDSHQALGQTIHELTADGQSLAKVIEFLRDASGSNLVVNWTVLEQAGVTKETPISLSLREVPLRKVLQLVLNQASPQTTLTYSVDANVIQITSQDDLDKQLITKVFIVDDLVMVSNSNVQAPTLNLNSVGANSSSGGSGGSGFGGQGGGSGGQQSGGGFGGQQGGGSGSGLLNTSNSNNQTKETSEQKGQQLVDLIKDVIRPNIWKDNGGTASIRYFNGKLIVTAPVSVLEAIGGPVGASGIRFGS